ncbi:MAG: NUDIX domain-containing protein [Edaphocola sp.]
MYLQKIFVNDAPLILTTDAASYINQHPEAAEYLMLTGASAADMRMARKELEQQKYSGALLQDESAAALQQTLDQVFEPITAAGGVVYEPTGKVLMIYRRDKWDLPKGKHDEGETIAECALREVQEETGVANLALHEKIGETLHVYTQGKHEYLKTTHWFRMTVPEAQALVPQAEEQIADARWVAPKDLGKCLTQSYAAVAEVLGKAGLQWL